MSDLYLADNAEGRAVEQVVRGLTAEPHPGQLSMIRRLSRIALQAMVQLVGPDETSSHFAALSRAALEMRGCGKGRKRA